MRKPKTDPIDFNWSTTDCGNLQCYKEDVYLLIYFPNEKYPFYDVVVQGHKQKWYRKSFRNLGTAIIHAQQEVVQTK